MRLVMVLVIFGGVFLALAAEQTSSKKSIQPTVVPEQIPAKTTSQQEEDFKAADHSAGREQEAEVRVAWEKKAGAKAYELEFRAVEGEGNYRRFKTSQLSFKAFLPPGPYFFRIRSIDQLGDIGNWSSPVKIIARPREVVLKAPANGEQVQAKEKTAATTFRWEPFKDAKTYILRVWSKKLKKKKVFKTKETKVTLNLLRERQYFWDVITVNKEGVLYQRKSDPFSFILVGEQLPAPEIKVVAPKSPKGVKWYQFGNAQYSGALYRKDILGEEWKLYAKNKRILNGRWLWKKKLTPGHYRVDVQAKAAARIDSNLAQEEFFVKPKLSEILSITAQP